MSNPHQTDQVYRLRVLIADDAKEARRGTRLMLSIHPGVEVVAIAQDGRQAVEMAREQRPDIAILDVNMPEMSGLQAIQAMREFLPNTIYIIISAENDKQTLDEARAIGVNDYLIKPFTYEDLDAALNRASRLWMAGRQPAEHPAYIPAPELAELKQQARQFLQERRADNDALAVYERLAGQPGIEPLWLVTLAVVYALRQEWGKLRSLAERLE